MTTNNGLLIIDKPQGLTSHDVVARVRKVLHERKVGHAGTLDPMATGVLVVGVGPSTRLLRFAQGQNKRYTGFVQLGTGTDSLDADGVVTETLPVPSVSEVDAAAAAHQLTGSLSQIPPMVSALKVDGRRLHALARQGLDIERAPRNITIQSFTVAPTMSPTLWQFSVGCSVGTYVRVLLYDWARALGTVGHLTALRREASGSHTTATAIALDDLAERWAAGEQLLAPPRAFVGDLTQVTVSDEQLLRLHQGKRLHFEVTDATQDVAVLDGQGNLRGIVHRRDDGWQPDVVLPGVVA